MNQYEDEFPDSESYDDGPNDSETPSSMDEMIDQFRTGKAIPTYSNTLVYAICCLAYHKIHFVA